MKELGKKMEVPELHQQDTVRSEIKVLTEFRRLNHQITNEKAVTACLLVLQGSAYNGVPLDVNQVAGT